MPAAAASLHRSLADHVEHPALGEVPTGSGVREGAAGGSCGVVARCFIEVTHGRVRECAFRVRGRASAFATASALAEAVRGRTVLEAARLGLTTLHPSFGAMDAEDEERARVVEDAFHHALGGWLLDRMREPGEGAGLERPSIAPAVVAADRPAAIVGMSGGVDSAVALQRLSDAHGGSVVGATLRLWIDPQAPDPNAACCSPDAVRRARRTCHERGLAHLSIDLRGRFAAMVVAPFVDRYRSGETPNPCVGCNGGFRLDELVRLGDVVGAPRIATGHYARRVQRHGVTLVQRGVDPAKDQSYMLATVHAGTLERLRFPLGADRKEDVRAEARRLGMAQAELRESQEVCFLGGGDYRRFLRRAGALGPTGTIRLEDGTALRRHDGLASFTPGQRRGIGVNHPDATGAALYVLDVDPASGDVTVGDRTRLGRASLSLRDVRLPAGLPVGDVGVQVRHRMRGGTIPARVVPTADGHARLELAANVEGAAAGQLAALYDPLGVVVGTGIIVRQAAGSSDPAGAKAGAEVEAREHSR